MNPDNELTPEELYEKYGPPCRYTNELAGSGCWNWGACGCQLITNEQWEKICQRMQETNEAAQAE